MGWNDLDVIISNRINQPNDLKLPFLKVENKVRIRILNEPEVYLKHFIKTISGKNNSIRCPGRITCPLCKSGKKPIKRCMFIVLDRADGVVKLYDAPTEVGIQLRQLESLKLNTKGKIFNYDVIITRINNKNRTDYYVTDEEVSPLTPQETEFIKNSLGNFDLKKYLTPHTNEEIIAIQNEQYYVSKQDFSTENSSSTNTQTIPPKITSSILSQPIQNVQSQVPSQGLSQQPIQISTIPQQPVQQNVQQQSQFVSPQVIQPIQSQQNIQQQPVQPPIVTPTQTNTTSTQSEGSSIGRVVENTYFNNFLK